MSQDLQINPYNFHQPYNHVENPFSTINTTYRQMGSTYMDDSSSHINLDQYYPSPYNFMSFSEIFLLPGPVDPGHDTISSGFGFNYIANNEGKQQEITKAACASENDHQVTTNSTLMEGVLGDEDSNTCNMKKDKQVKGSQEDEESPKKESNKSKKKLGTEKKERQSRFAFMTKSEIDNLEDGYRWRKYGQKAVKNSPYPRSYYRCTTQKCTVKKRVERSLQDPSIVITTYEGTHNHHVPSNLRGNINVAAGLLYPSTLHHAASSSFLPELFVQMQQVYGHGGGGVTTSSGSGSGSGSNSNSNNTMYQQQQTLTTPFQHMQFSDCGLLQDIVPSSIFLKQEH